MKFPRPFRRVETLEAAPRDVTPDRLAVLAATLDAHAETLGGLDALVDALDARVASHAQLLDAHAELLAAAGPTPGAPLVRHELRALAARVDALEDHAPEGHDTASAAALASGSRTALQAAADAAQALQDVQALRTVVDDLERRQDRDTASSTEDVRAVAVTVDNLSQDLDRLRARVQGVETRASCHSGETAGRFASLRARVLELEDWRNAQDDEDDDEDSPAPQDGDELDDARAVADYVDATVEEHVRQLRDLASTMKAHATQDGDELDDALHASTLETYGDYSPFQLRAFLALVDAAVTAAAELDPARLNEVLPTELVSYVARTLHSVSVGDPAPPRMSWHDLTKTDQERLRAQARYLVVRTLDWTQDHAAREADKRGTL